MKLKNLFKAIGLTALFMGMATMVQSCSDDDKNGGPLEFGSVTGVVTDEFDAPLEGVTVTNDENETTALTDAAGKFTIENISVGSHIITFSKADYQTVSVTVYGAKFDKNRVATVSAYMEYAAAKIRGVVIDSKAGGAPLAGATVSVSASQSVTTGADGAYEISNLPLKDYTVTFAKTGYTAVTRNIKVSDFTDGVATLDIAMGATEILPGLTKDDMEFADRWYYNEYRGGRNADAYPHWDWACNYMCTNNFVGDWEEQNEGTTLRIRNSADDQRNNPVDLEHFDSFTYGRKLITADNHMMTLTLRTHSASDDAPAHYGVQVIDLSEAEPKPILIGGVKTLNSEPYVNREFDLSAYDGKEVVIAIGTFRAQTGDYWKQLVLRTIRFTPSSIGDDLWSWLPGTPVEGLDGWQMTMEMVRSTMPHTKNAFTGMCQTGGNRDNYFPGYREWRAVDHVAANWSYMPLQKDPEVFPSEGYLIKTKGDDAIVSTKLPQSYFYSKFAIAGGSNRLTLTTRNFSSNATFFKVTAITEDGTVTHLSPESNTARMAEAAADGCWKFVHEAGDANHPDEYAKFVYDLSAYNGRNVVIAIGIFKGEANGDENKLVLCAINID
ncbi:MAG: carboxypeptidase regulatory-like domain-containing protein [Muribaculaceae bacterium]|nr:carboxypeptidase regulatory-like domain-containing protein [Muribaculaceae bacterium]